MRIGIIAPKFNFPTLKRYEFPVGLAYIQGALKRTGKYEIFVLNLSHRWGDICEIIKEWLIQHRIQVVMTGGLSIHYSRIKKIIDATKNANPDIITIGGGGGFSSEPILFSEMTGVDYACIGEGEITICELMNKISENGGVSNVLGIVWKNKDGSYKQNPIRPPIENLDDVPFPDYEGFELQEFLDNQTPFDTYFHFSNDFPRVMPIFLGRSCPYQCNFCFHPLGNKYRQRSLDNFFAELDLLLMKYRINTLGIHDELFSLKREIMVQFCERIKPYHLKWSIQLRVDLVDEDLLRLLKDAGCLAISYGIESMNESILKNMKKHITPEQIANALALTRKVGIVIQGNFIFGDEKETWGTFRETMRWWRNHREYHLNLVFIETYPGTELYKHSVEKGLIPDRREFIEKGCHIINMTSLPDEDFKRMRAIVSLEKYRGGVEGKVLSIEDTKDGFCTIELECPDCHAVTIYKRLERLRIYSNHFMVPCRSCQQKHLFDLRKFLGIYDSEYKHTLYFNLLKHWAIANYSLPYPKEMKVAFLYDNEFGELFFKMTKGKIQVAYIVDERYAVRYNKLKLDVPIIAVEDIQQYDNQMATECMVIMDIVNYEKKRKMIKDAGYRGRVCSLLDFIMEI